MNVASSPLDDEGYRRAEQRAAHYLSLLSQYVEGHAYVPLLTQDFRAWKQHHLPSSPWLSLFTRAGRQPENMEAQAHIRRLQKKGKLDEYLDRSISYIYMRDLGHALGTPKTERKIARMAEAVKSYLLRDESASLDMDLAEVLRWARKEGVESAVIWVIEKLKAVSARIPEQMDAEHAERKLIKIIAGVVLQVLDDLDEGVAAETRALRLDEALRLGYAYGLTYPFIDDLLDSDVLAPQEKEQYSRMIRLTLQTGAVPELRDHYAAHNDFVTFVHAELRDAFQYIRSLQKPGRQTAFLEQASLFFQAQHVDRIKDLSDAGYTNEELYIPVILKSSSSRRIVRSVVSSPDDAEIDHRLFCYGLYNQLSDDFADLQDDLNRGAVTPYTYYITYRDQRPDLINPFAMYWAVIAHLIHHVYASEPKTREVILDRAINGLKRCKARLGGAKYRELMERLAVGEPEWERLIQQMVRKAVDVDFYDKLIRDKMVSALRQERADSEAFLRTLRTAREQINGMLRLPPEAGALPAKATLIEAANYSIEGGGKRLRPILAWVMGVREYGLEASALVPLLRSIEYMHTASLIFDDLPSQDDASERRGRPTLHRRHDQATAELTGLYLIQKAIQEQASLINARAEVVVALMRYSAERAEDLCAGQVMDLRARGETLTLEELNRLAYYKTGVAFEASIVMPALLAQAPESEIAALKTYAYHAGIAFQIKDDVLDAAGDAFRLGKPVGQDAANGSSTFVTVLGLEGAKKQMWEHYELAAAALAAFPAKTGFLKQALLYMVSRSR